MSDEPGSAAVEFDGHVYAADDLLRVMRAAALGFVPTDDRQIAFDPVGWTAAFVRGLRDTPLRSAMASAMTELLLSDDGREARFGAQVTRITGVMPPETISQAIVRQSQHQRLEVVAELAWGLASASLLPRYYAYDPALRAVLDQAPSALGLIEVVSRFDPEWFVEHVPGILAEEVDEAARQIAHAEIGAANVPWFGTRLRARLATSRPDLAPLV